MSKHKIFGLLGALSLFGLGACNSTYEPGESIASSVAVYSFSIRSTNNALAGIDTVFFSIDLVNAHIFNADSLPYGTKITSIIPKVQTLDGVSVCEFYVSRSGKQDTVYDILNHPEDSINFTEGPVRLRIVSPDAAVERYYKVDINVHKMKSDSLEWSVKARRPLPTRLANPTASGSAYAAGKLYCVTADATGAYDLEYTEDAYNGEWRYIAAPFAGIEQIRPSSLRGGENTLYILGESGRLYTSADGGMSWTDTGRDYTEVFGELNGVAVGTGLDANGDYVLIDGRTGAALTLPGDDFPVSGASPAAEFDFPMSAGKQLVILGGRTAAGSLSDAAWAYDGKSWLKVTNVPLPQGMENMAVVPYTTFDDDKDWDADKYASLLAFGGNDASGNLSSTVYISRDYGMSWRKADANLQMPDYLPAARGMQGFVINHLTLASDPEAEALGIFAPLSRATEPVREWEVPYIYLVGGTVADGTLNAYIWRGVINRLSFKPLI